MTGSGNIQLILIATSLTLAPSVTLAAPAAPSSPTASAVSSAAIDMRGWGVGSYHDV